MRAVILCAGEGTRMRPLTYSKAKHLIPIANKPVIDLILKAVKDAGIREIGIVVSPGARAGFTSYLQDGSSNDLNLSYIVQQKPKGLAHAVQCAQGFVGSEPFLLYLGDNLLENGVRGLVEQFQQGDSHAAISLVEVDNPRSFGVAWLEEDEIKRVVEKPDNPLTNLAVIGTYVFDHHIFAAIEKISPSKRGELEITDAIQQLIDDGYRVVPHRVAGWWKDVGTPADMIDANQLLLDAMIPETRMKDGTSLEVKGNKGQNENAKVRDSRLIAPVMLGKDVVIEGSVIGPYVSIGDGVIIRNSKIENSIILEKAVIMGARSIDRSLIGRYAEVKSMGDSSSRFLLGDHSQALI